MPNIYDEITQWATRSLPFWEQAALDRILAGDPITNDVVTELVDCLLEDANLQRKSRVRPGLCYLAANGGNPQASISKVRLSKIYNLKNINALVPNQVLEFGDDLTVIFGSNGSGKSGYARVIGSAAFTRGDRQILRNIAVAKPSEEPLSADIELKTQDGQIIPIHHLIGENCPQLRSFYVFDSTSVKNHLTRENPMSFAPAGLEALTMLSALTDRVRKALEERCVQKDASKNIFDAIFTGETRVKAYIRTLGPSTDLAALEKLAQVSPDDREKAIQLEFQIAEIHSQRIIETINQLNQEIQDLESLRTSVLELEKWMDSEEFTSVNQVLQSFAASATRQDEPGKKPIPGNKYTGWDRFSWEKFVHAAYELGRVESANYPGEGDRCLLCGQPLHGDTRDLIHRIWDSINNEEEAQRKAAGNKVSSVAASVSKVTLDYLNPNAAAYRCLQRVDPEALKILGTNIQETVRICDQLKSGLDNRRSISVNPKRVVGSAEIQRVIDQLAGERQKLELQNTEQRLAQLEKELLELQHRMLLKEHLEAIKDFVERTKWVKHASSSTVKRNTKHITKKFNDLFDELVTKRYIQLFEQTLVKLKCPLRMRVDTRGVKGETLKQIVLIREDNESITNAAPDKVLSEGEQRAVALADFLTEVALNENSSGILLDDPVTSLDFQWKETIAEHIVEEASRQQVIIFTHDLHFLYCIKNFAEDHKVNIASHWIQKRDDHPGWVYLNNSPVSEKDFKTSTKAKEYLTAVKAKGLDAEKEQHLLQSGFGALRTSYEAFIMFDLFGGVVLRFEERISGDRLKSVYIDERIRDEVIESVGRLSRYIEAHLHSDASMSSMPTSKTLADEIARFDDLKVRHKQMKKDHGIKD